MASNEIELHNELHEKRLRGKISLDDTKFPWENADLLRLLTRPLDRIYERRNISEEDRSSEQAVVSLANNAISDINRGDDTSHALDMLREHIRISDGYQSQRMQTILWNLEERVAKRKGLVIYGEGGIGKTYFFYDLLQELKKEGKAYVLAFDSDSIRSASYIGIRSVGESFGGKFTLIIDACNELDEADFMTACNLIKQTLDLPLSNVVVSTRKDSPDSRLDELKDLLPASILFEGVDGNAAFNLLAGFPNSIYAQYQPFLLSHNPRTIKALVHAIQKKLDENPRGKTALIQRTTIVEDVIERATGRATWEQTKTICNLLYNKKHSTFSYAEAAELLGAHTDIYLQTMLQNGFLAEFSDVNDISYYFTSESQLQWLVARSVNDDLNDISFTDEEGAADSVAAIIAAKSTYLTVHEMCQAAVDRYINLGPEIFMNLIRAFRKADLDFDFWRVVVNTVFPDDFDFAAIDVQKHIDIGKAFLRCGGIHHKPLNLTNFANEAFLDSPRLLDKFYNENWTSSSLTEIRLRVKNIAELVARTEEIPEGAKSEWLWLSVWTSWSPEPKLRSWGQRLMFVLCDANESCTREIIDIWSTVDDVYVRRAIACTLSHLSNAQRSTPVVLKFLDDAAKDSSLTDSITISYLIDLSSHKLSFIDFSSSNFYESSIGKKAAENELKKVQEMADFTDLLIKGFLPVDTFQLNRGNVDFDGVGSFVNVPKKRVKEWNDRLTELLPCKPGGQCDGMMIWNSKIDSILQIPFESSPLDNEALLYALTETLKASFSIHGGTLDDGLGNFGLDYSPGPTRTPIMKVLDVTFHMLLGSVAANYYTDNISLCAGPACICGFSAYEESRYQEPAAPHICIPAANTLLERVKRQLSKRFDSPSGKPSSWYEHHINALEEMASLIKPIETEKTVWRPLALSARKKVRGKKDGHVGFSDLQCSNEYILSFAFKFAEHIQGSQEDRRLTIEHRNYSGNIKDYGSTDGGLCLWLPSPDTENDNPNAHQILLPPPSVVSALELHYMPT